MGSTPTSATLTMASCWNGIQGGLKNRCPKGRVGSSPTEATKIQIMGKPKKVIDISAADYIKIKLEDKEILNNALKNGENINDVAIKRGIKLVQPI